jgi:hypothetical protein
MGETASPFTLVEVMNDKMLSWADFDEQFADPKPAKLKKAYTSYNVKFVSSLKSNLPFGYIETQSTADLPIPGLRPVPQVKEAPLPFSTDSRRFRED